jgi:DNA polymerase III gamma/tau subunit
MLSGGAFNALLKTLEEPPSYVIFILATTEPHKLPATILSRCQRFDFRRISDGAIISRLGYIAECAGVAAGINALRLIAKLSEGSLRDAISIFDQCVAAKSDAALELDDVLRITGRPGDDNLARCARILLDGEIKAIPDFVAELSAAGMNLIIFIDGMTEFFKDLLNIKFGRGREAFPEMSGDIFGEAVAMAERGDIDLLLAVSSEFSTMAYAIKGSSNQTVMLEVSLAKICLRRFHAGSAIEGLNARVNALEKKLEGTPYNELRRRPDEHPDAQTPTGRAAEPQMPAEEIAEQQTPTMRAAEPQTPAGEIAERQTPTMRATEPQTQADEVTEPQTLADEVAEPQTPADNVAEPAEIEKTTPPAPQKTDGAEWTKIVDNFKNKGDPMFYTILQGTSSQIIGETFRIILPANMAPHITFLSSAANMAMLRGEIHAMTGRAYNVQVLSENDAFLDIAKKMKQNFNIQTNIHP